MDRRNVHLVWDLMEGPIVQAQLAHILADDDVLIKYPVPNLDVFDLDNLQKGDIIVIDVPWHREKRSLAPVIGWLEINRLRLTEVVIVLKTIHEFESIISDLMSKLQIVRCYFHDINGLGLVIYQILQKN